MSYDYDTAMDYNDAVYSGGLDGTIRKWCFPAPNNGALMDSAGAAAGGGIRMDLYAAHNFSATNGAVFRGTCCFAR